MQDRFKFRVWSNIAKKYIEDFRAPIGSDYQLILTQDGELCELGLGDYDVSDEHSWGSLKQFSDCIIMQCTGLKDKNGKLIYEGDIVKDDHGAWHYVKWVYDSWQLFPCTQNNYTIGIVDDEIEVIGNIYENPELLTTKNPS